MEIAERAALNARIPLKLGVLGALTGPNYETPAEVRMLASLGADAVCMSTAAEAVEGARLGMEVMGISCITNRAAGLSDRRLDHAEVISTANRVKAQFKTLLKEIIKAI
jgi:purine-nucleoside phosphorylase